jgi:DNA-binding NtrC family response regulator
VNLHRVTKVHSAEEARQIIRKNPFDIVLLDKYLPNDQIGISLIPEIKAALPHAVIIMLTAEKPDESVLEALQAGACDYLQKTPTVTSDLLGRIAVALQRIALEKRLQKAESLASDRMNLEMVGKSTAIQNLKETIKTLARNDINVLISGETGTGKELVARALNQTYGDATRPFVTLNCGAFPAGLVESELFGHSKGAFTGATADKIGKIELAHERDLFLDEIGELSLEIQVKLLRILQEGEFYRVGCNQKRRSKFRVISATNRDLHEMVAANKFREDLYYRIAAYEIHTTPLCHRKEDIPELVDYFVRRMEGPRYYCAQETIEYFMKQRWKGNIRELENKLRSALAFAKARNSYVITLNDVVHEKEKTREIRFSLKDYSDISSRFQYTAAEYESYMEEIDKTYLMGALDANDWDLELVARKLGISRSKVYQRIAKYDLKAPKPFKRKAALL